jgi:peptide deformylase
MAVRKIIRMGHPVLRRVAQPLRAEQLGTEWFARLVGDMTETLHDYGGIGLAAPQIAEPWRVAIIEIAGGPSRYGDIPSMPLTVFVNPTIEVLDSAMAGYWEGCLSVPGLRGYVERPQSVRIRYLDRTGTPAELQLEGFLATVFQHEFDHLDGRLYIDRITDPRRLCFEDEYFRYIEPTEAHESAGAREPAEVAQ